VLPKAPYSDQKGNQQKNGQKRHNTSSWYGGEVLREFFTFRMFLKFSLHVLPSASIQGMLELCMFIFLADNTDKKTNFSPIALPMLVFTAYYITYFLINIFKCERCYSLSPGYREENRTRCCGAFWAFFGIAAFTALVVLGAMADNNLINGGIFDILKNFNLYFIVAVALGLTTIILNK
jgi:hypothetical protein